MPELPEVETTARYLRDRVLGARIIDAKVSWARTIATSTPRRFIDEIVGAEIQDIFRRGKFIGISIEHRSKRFLFAHLRMSGSFDVVSKDLPIGAHDRVLLYLDNDKSIRFSDPRKFGRIYLCRDPQEIVGKLGIEPLSDECTVSFLTQILQRHRGSIKPLLLNQSVLAGIGNIYADEVLWKSNIHPLTSAARIPTKHIEALHANIKSTLTTAITLAGTDFGDGVVDGGMYVPSVYGREDEPCERCSTPIKKIIVGQRGTHFCPKCQRRRAIRRTSA